MKRKKRKNKQTKQQWDADWDNLSADEKADRIRDHINETEQALLSKIRSANNAASSALYVANYCK